MRKVIYSIFTSLDGYIEDASGSLDWAIVDEELHRYANDMARTAGADLYGRRMYELMVSSWPEIDKNPQYPDYMLEFATIWKEMPKVVFSTTLTHAEWNTRLINKNIVEEVKNLKAQPGNDLYLGGANIASSFLKSGLIDELKIFIHPVILGTGKPMLQDIKNKVALQLVETRTFKSGVVMLHYRIVEQITETSP